MTFARQALSLPLFTLFAIVAIGVWVGSIRVRGISLGAAGVLFVGFVFGHFGFVVPEVLRDIGLVLFVYSVGLQAGPRFFGILRARGKVFLTVALVSTSAGAVATIGLAKLLHLSPPLAAGLFTGATTSTPALAAAIDVVRSVLPGQGNTVSVGYGLAYPFSVISLVVFIQVLPALLRTTGSAAAQRAAREAEGTTPPLETVELRVANPNCDGRTVEQLQALRISDAKISRVKHERRVQPARPDTALHLGDVVLAVGTPSELAKLTLLVGTPTDEPMSDPMADIASEEIVISRPSAVGRSLRDLSVWEEFGLVVTRVRREGIEFSPTGSFVLEPGDIARVVGSSRDVDQFAAAVGQEERRLDETSLMPFAAGLVLGVLLGMVPIPLPGGLKTQLGMGGGTLLAALVLGHVGHVGPVRIYVPNAAKYLARELGLVIFLAGTGSGAGVGFVHIVQQAGPQLILGSVLVTAVTVAVAFYILYGYLRWNMLSAAGALSGCMTDTAGLAAAARLADSDAAPVAFASVYPVALLCKIILAQLVFVALRL